MAELGMDIFAVNALVFLQIGFEDLNLFLSQWLPKTRNKTRAIPGGNHTNRLSQTVPANGTGNC